MSSPLKRSFPTCIQAPRARIAGNSSTTKRIASAAVAKRRLMGRERVPGFVYRGARASRSGASERNGDELRRIVGLPPHKNGMFATLPGLADGFAHLRRSGDLGAANLKNDVAALESVL